MELAARLRQALLHSRHRGRWRLEAAHPDYPPLEPMTRAEPVPRAETLVPPSASAAMSRYRIVRDDGISDGIAGQAFDSYDAAHVVLERYYGDLCCSDEREYYRIEELSGGGEQVDGQPG